LAENKAEVREEKKEAKAAGPAVGNATNGTKAPKPVPYGPRD
jgi:hypothetical protein